jgi:regulator of RNase E activity RraA
MHVFARGASHLGPGKRGPGDVHAAVTLGGTVVRTNDIVVGDADGIAIIPNARIAATLVGAQALLEREVQLLERAASGNMDLTWLHEEVTQVGVPALAPGPVLGGPAGAERR